jgi:hypothetical protein
LATPHIWPPVQSALPAQLPGVHAPAAQTVRAP